MPTLIYLHGFLSSPLSLKAQQTKQWLNEQAPDWHCLCPELSSKPAEAILQLKEMMAGLESSLLERGNYYFIGSSLGGFWATWLRENYGGKAVLVNPAVAPHTRFVNYVGTIHQSYYSDKTYTLTEDDLAVLTQCYCCNLSQPAQYRVMLQTGDETLDYRDAQKYYGDCEQWLEEGGNHSFEGYSHYLPKILAFFSD